MVVYIQRMAVDQERWLDEVTFRKGVALCQTVPGATAIQAAAYVGLKVRGIFGAFVAFVGFGLPAVLLIAILSMLYTKVTVIQPVTIFFTGLQALVVAIVATATITFGRQLFTRFLDMILAGIAAVLFLAGVHPILIILLAGMLGVMLLKSQFIEGRSHLLAPPQPPTFSVTSLVLVVIAGTGFLVLLFLNPLLFNIASTMARIDLFAFGGGQAALPLMLHEVVVAHGWMDSMTFLNGVALGQITPGPIVVTATFVGYLVQGWSGAFCATVGIFTPSFLVIILAEPYYEYLLQSPLFSRALQGVILSFVGLLFSTTVRFALAVPWTWFLGLLAIGAAVALDRGIKIIWVVLIGVALSIAYSAVLLG
ncbi:MAG: chromate efflux transporter [Methanomicrobiales archaeon]|nr:chromate efflux transporter [Methanomicrobiales archaeon]